MNKDTIFDTPNHLADKLQLLYELYVLGKECHIVHKNTVGQRCRNSRHLVTQVIKFYVHLFIHSIGMCRM